METDTLDGDVIFRTNQRPNDQFVQALKELEVMKQKEKIRNYGVQNSTMDDVFSRLTRQSNGIDLDRSLNTLEKQCHRLFTNDQFFIGFFFHLSQFTGLLMKSLRVHSRRWALTLLVLLLPLLYNVLSNLISRRRQDFGIFAMDVQSLNPQTILVRSDPTMIDFFRSTVMTSTSSRRRNGVTLEERSESLEEMNTLVRDRRMHRPSTYTEIYLAFDVSPFRLRAASSNLISSYEVIDVASNLFYKYAMNDTDVSIKTTLVYKTTGNWTEQFSIGDLMNILSMASCALKFLPTSLLLDVFLFYLLFFYSAVFLISERKDRFLSLLNISGLQ